MAKGSITRIVADKAFGFIRDDAGGAEYFFHRSAVEDGRFAALSVGDRVTFEPGNGPKGPRAEDVALTDD
jgi:CspA family cold shock protein